MEPQKKMVQSNSHRNGANGASAGPKSGRPNLTANLTGAPPPRPGGGHGVIATPLPRRMPSSGAISYRVVEKAAHSAAVGASGRKAAARAHALPLATLVVTLLLLSSFTVAVVTVLHSRDHIVGGDRTESVAQRG
jgi:hypothetical protein